MKRIITAVVCIISSLTIICGMTGCIIRKDDGVTRKFLPEYESGDLKYAVKTNRDGTKKGYIIGFTEAGKEKKEIVFPAEIDGIPIVGVSYGLYNVVGIYDVGYFVSEKLEKLYVPINIKAEYWEGEPGGYYDCPNCRQVLWKGGRLWGFDSLDSRIISYNVFDDFIDESKLGYNNYLANVTYMYNYENAENDGVYWVDGYNNSLISFIPPEPKREGYTFGGWYKEAECTTAWDFETVTIGGVMTAIYWNSTKENTSPSTKYLYAKWIKN